MWQIAWMWGLIPIAVLGWLINLLLVAGVVGIMAGWIGRWIPIFDAYARLLKPLGIVLLLIGVYFKGGYSIESAHRAESDRLQKLVEIAEAKSQDANKKLDSAVKEKNRAIQESKTVVQTRLKIDSVKIDAECRLDPAAVEILNQSAKDIPQAKPKR
jgi:hypothetical protein